MKRLSLCFRRLRPGFCLAVGLLPTLSLPAEVRLWETNEVLPTYQVAPPDPNPRFYEGRTYQGARAPFYPYPVTDRLTDERKDQSWRMVYLENECVRVAVAPELGGRIFSAVDRSNGYDFFYRQRVVKPALIGMLGAWISGGVEWNVPHHHRASSFARVPWTTAEEPDGGRTVWVGETEWRHRMQWAVGVTLRPGSSVIEMRARMANRTPVAHSMLFWINPAVHANTNYQVLFPPGTEFATQHGKPEFAHWPIAREIYGGVDYTQGVDISWWKNHPSPVSFFAWNFADDWFGGYDHGRQAGVLHVADHHLVPGKKFFEWGVGGAGEMWSTILTDEDGPYLELMAGAWSDNQPDYSWIQPGETREWTHHWYPVRGLGGVKAATVHAALNLEVGHRTVRVAAYATAQLTNAVLRLKAGDLPLLEQSLAIGPARPFATTLMTEVDVVPERLRLSLATADGRELVSYQPPPPKRSSMPVPVKRPAPPKDVASADELFFTGQRIEQLHSPSFEAAPYYEEMLKRDSGDHRANTALGILLCRQWRWADAEARLRQGLERATTNYVRPKDGEAFYYLGVALKAQERLEEAYDAYQRAAWSLGWRAASHAELAGIDCRAGRYSRALEQIDRSLGAGANNPRARNLQAVVLRKLGRTADALQAASAALAWNPLDAWASWEMAMARAHQEGRVALVRALNALRNQLGRGDEAWLEIVADYANAGLWEDAVTLLELLTEHPETPGSPGPMVAYWLGWGLDRVGRIDQAVAAFARAARIAPDFCFPFRPEEEAILRRAMERNPVDSRAPYYLGNLLYDQQPEAAIAAWEKARALNASFALVHRNLGLAYAQVRGDHPAAIASLERAVELNPGEPRFLYELDVQLEAAGAAVERRLAMLERHHAVAAVRDDALTRQIGLLLAAGRPEQALGLLTGRRFHNWEGSDDIRDMYVEARLLSGQAQLQAGHAKEALREFEAALEFPTNLEVGRPYRDPQAPQIQFYCGEALAAAGRTQEARERWQQAARAMPRAPAEIQYCQGLALRRLGRETETRPLFEGLIRQGRERLERGATADYFAKFGQRQAERVRQAEGHYLIGLGLAGLGQDAEAKAAFQKALELHPAHVGAAARVHRP